MTPTTEELQKEAEELNELKVKIRNTTDILCAAIDREVFLREEIQKWKNLAYTEGVRADKLSEQVKELKHQLGDKDFMIALKQQKISQLQQGSPFGIKDFIKEVQREFPELNLEYLNFAADRFIERSQASVEPVKKFEREAGDEHDQFS